MCAHRLAFPRICFAKFSTNVISTNAFAVLRIYYISNIFLTKSYSPSWLTYLNPVSNSILITGVKWSSDGKPKGEKRVKSADSRSPTSSREEKRAVRILSTTKAAIRQKENKYVDVNAKDNVYVEDRIDETAWFWFTPWNARPDRAPPLLLYSFSFFSFCRFIIIVGFWQWYSIVVNEEKVLEQSATTSERRWYHVEVTASTAFARRGLSLGMQRPSYIRYAECGWQVARLNATWRISSCCRPQTSIRRTRTSWANLSFRSVLRPVSQVAILYDILFPFISSSGVLVAYLCVDY